MNSFQNPLQSKSWFFGVISATSGILLGLSFPPSPLFSLAYIAFIPMFYLFAQIDSYKKLLKHAYLFLFVFHLLTLYWTGGFVVGKDIWMMAAGTAVILIHPIFFLPIFLCALFVRKRSGLIWSLIAFALFWTSFEYLHSLGEYSFPWLTIGNSQSYDINRIQMIEYTSVYGLTLFIFIFNIGAFLLVWNIAQSRWRIRSTSTITAFFILLLVYMGPVFFGTWVIKNQTTAAEKIVSVGVVQPNFDPWEKWNGGSNGRRNSYDMQFNTYLAETRKLAPLKPDLMIWPETAIPFPVLMPRYVHYMYALQSMIDTLGFPIFTGLPAMEYFDSLHAPATAQQIGTSDLYVESYNASVLFRPKDNYGPVHKKSILVPFAERIPYAETFRFLIEPLKWNVGISGWGKGEDTLVYTFDREQGNFSTFSGMICYESVYPNYTRELVKRGAEFLVIITNDSWWGKTSGAYQHASFASLRAVETRRWIVQCANGGISLIIDPTGKIVQSTKLYTQAQFVSNIGLRKNETWFVRYGECIPHACVVISALVLIAASILKKKGG